VELLSFGRGVKERMMIGDENIMNHWCNTIQC